MKNKHIRRQIYADCFRAEAIPMLFYSLSDCVTSLLTVYTAGILGTFADAVFRLDFTAGLDNLWKLLLCLGITILLMPVIRCIAEILDLYFALVYERLVLGRFLDKEYAHVMQYSPGEVQHRLDWAPIDMRCSICTLVTDSLWILVTTGALLFSALQVSPLFTLIMLAVTAWKLTVPVIVRKLEKRYDMERRQYEDKVRSLETEITADPCQVKLFGLSGAFVRRLEDAFDTYYTTTAVKNIRCTQTAGQISAFLGTFCTVLLLFSGTILTAAGQITPGTVAAMFGYFSVCGSIFDKTAGVIREWQKLDNSAERMELFYEDPEPTAGKDPGVFRGLYAEGLTFAYGDKTVFQNLSFSWNPGEKTAVTGPNGSGKSTLVQVLCMLRKGWSGSLRLNGIPAETVSPAAWRSRFAWVPQDPMLFFGTVQDNIALGLPEDIRGTSEGDRRVREICARLGIEALAERQIEAGKDSLSGGEKQKISIARALARNTPVLILDEPGNNLDAETLHWLAGFIRSCDKTILYVSHDPILTEAADRCICLEP